MRCLRTPGAVIVLPGNTSHFHWAKSGEYVAQVTAVGHRWALKQQTGARAFQASFLECVGHQILFCFENVQPCSFLAPAYNRVPHLRQHVGSFA